MDEEQQYEEGAMKDASTVRSGTTTDEDETARPEAPVKTMVTGGKSNYILVAWVAVLIFIPIVVLATAFGTRCGTVAEDARSSFTVYENVDPSIRAVFGPDSKLAYVQDECIKVESLGFSHTSSVFCPTEFAVDDILDLQVYDEETLVISILGKVHIYVHDSKEWKPLLNKFQFYSGIQNVGEEGFGQQARIIEENRLIVSSFHKVLYYHRHGDRGWVLTKEWEMPGARFEYTPDKALAFCNSEKIVYYSLDGGMGGDDWWQVDSDMPLFTYDVASDAVGMEFDSIVLGTDDDHTVRVVNKVSDGVLIENKPSGDVTQLEFEAQVFGGGLILDIGSGAIYSVRDQRLLNYQLEVEMPEVTVLDMVQKEQNIAVTVQFEDGTVEVHVHQE